ncbi:MAG TPA: PHP domain-containing protein [Solirubrobacteraceae bacterium]|nr:PHP domain-containing protein [Solirubrobacteraceae bacterium]
MYVELHCHSAFSFLDGASLPEELVAAALELGYEAVALTDHNSVSGSMEFAVAARGLGMRAIHGAEVDLDDGRHLTLLVEDATGWSSLCRILTRAHAHTRGRPGPPSQAHVPLTEVLEHADGLVCLSGCALRGVHDEPTLHRLREAFGPDRLRVELQRPFLRDDRARNRRLVRLAERLGVPCVATGNVHAHARSRAPLQDAFVAVRVHATLDASEPERRGNFSHVLTSPAAMAARFAEHPEAVAEAALLADRLRFDLGADLGYRYPGSEDAEAMRKLSELCAVQLEDRYAEATASIRSRAAARLQEELRLIEALSLPGFFLLHHDLLELAREVAVEVRGPASARALLPPGRGRGSSVSSIVCYLTGLSHVDPIANELLIGRFLNEELTSLPDIDLDFPRDVREVLIPRIHEHYGHDRSALVAAFPTYRARGAIRELGKVLGLPPGEIERVARGSEGWDAREVGADIENAFRMPGGERNGSVEPGAGYGSRGGAGGSGPAPGAGRSGSAPGAGRSCSAPGAGGSGPAPSPRSTGRWAWLARLSAQAQGLPRHLSQHSGGMIVATRPLVDCCPIVPAAMEGRQIVQWDKDSCADAGFLKIDLLGLGMLSAVERAVELIARTRDARIDLSRIPYDDPATYECIQNAETTGVFQIESRAQMQSLRRTRPESLEDITIQVAIVRPGPIQGGAVNPYIERRQRLRADPDFEVPYLHPSLEPALRETLGTIIFQDQVLEVAIAFAGFTPGEAEGLRRAMSRKRSDAAIRAHHDRFIAGAQRTHGVDEATAEEVFAMIKGFSGFGFPKAHGAAFGLLAYQSTWLRVHYGPELLCSLMNEQPMGFYPPDALVHEAQRRGIEVLPPDVNESGVECDIDSDGRVRIGLGYVRGVRRQEVDEIVAARQAGGRFQRLSALASRAGAGASSLELLAWSGACDSLAAREGEEGRSAAVVGRSAAQERSRRAAGAARRIALWQLGVATPGVGVAGGTQLALPLDLPAPPALRELSAWESMLADYRTTGLTTNAHPLALLRERLPGDAVSSRDLETRDHGTRIRAAGLVVARQRPGTANGIVFVLLEDEYGTINLIVPSAVYERHRLTVRTEPLVFIEGKLERFAAAGGAINVLVQDIAPLATPDRPLAQVKDFSMLDELERRRIAQGKAIPDPASAHEAPSAPGQAPASASPDDFRAVAPPVMSFASGRRR